ncbi:MAG: BON domain-containing protein [Desulfobulbus sp.]|nr:BON domain-containing protein [Desulfobulbus sp.]
MDVSGKIILVVVVLATIFGINACKQEGPAEKAGKKADQALEQIGKTIDQAADQMEQKNEHAEDYRDDAAITAKVKAEIANDPILKIAQISVTTTKGVVRLRGVVDSQQTIDRAMEIARRLTGVSSVDNGLVVKGPIRK